MINNGFLLHLNAFPGTGKLTVAREIAQWKNTQLIDNHMINNSVFALVRENASDTLPEDVWGYTQRIRDVVLDAMVNIAKPEFNFVMTNCFYQEDTSDVQIYSQIKEAAQKSGRSYIPILLTCDLEEHERRITNEDREKNLKMRDASQLKSMRDEFSLCGKDHANALVLDITDLQPHETAQKIRTHVSKVLTI